MVKSEIVFQCNKCDEISKDNDFIWQHFKKKHKTKSYLDDKNVTDDKKKKIWIANELKQAGTSSAKAETVKVNWAEFKSV